jgi:hypothetical protein
VPAWYAHGKGCLVRATKKAAAEELGGTDNRYSFCGEAHAIKGWALFSRR